jgi:hypothetical protein
MGQNLNNQLVEKLGLFLDKQLTNEDESELLDHVKLNPEAQQILTRDQNIRQLIKDNVGNRKASTQLIENIKLKIRKPPM